MSAARTDEDMSRLEAQLIDRIQAAQSFFDEAKGVFELAGDHDVPLAALAPGDRYAYVSARANLATAQASMALVQSQLALRWLLEELIAATKAGLPTTSA